MSLIATLFYLFFVSWKLTLIMMVTPPVLGWVVLAIQRVLEYLSRYGIR